MNELVEEKRIRFRHDLEKPKALVQMFFDVVEEVAKNPDELEAWKRNILKAFDNAYRRLDET